MIGRRVVDVEHINQPGDYAGPFTGYTDGATAVFFLIPIPSDVDTPPSARRLHHVTSPPHTFRECDDGSLEVRASIGARDDTDTGYMWHGYLDEGHTWRTA